MFTIQHTIVICETSEQWDKVRRKLLDCGYKSLDIPDVRFSWGNCIIIYSDKDFMCINSSHKALVKYKCITVKDFFAAISESANPYGEDEYALPEELKNRA